ncbi:uncharacterized protein LOC109821353 [Asparagus officinalis]|uniref:uncharacterized protein LOC109821353 n=1 Tax=Asparagus officinalis TaxID=4686 RepID=UPI00098E6FE3|nr:uncharacterized protein LOC109821353 [Asparagus officinalis]
MEIESLIAKNNKHNNRVMVLHNANGDRITDGEGIVNEFISFYRKLMGSAVVTIPPDMDIINSGPILNTAQARELSRPVTRDEIKSAIFSMAEDKAPGPDGYNVSFFKSAWTVIGEEVIEAIEEFFSSGKLLGMVMIGWILACITSPSYSLSLNGSLHGYFKGKRGLRQGDPLSPYLFILSMEYLSRKLRVLKNDRLFKFHPKCSQLNITHLIFADDLLLFAKGDVYSVHKLFQCVKEFSAVSGLEANPEKCSVFFGGIDESVKSSINNYLGFSKGVLPFKYLGVPLTTKKLSHMDCNALLSKISGQFQKWLNHGVLSYAGRLQIIKSVILGVQIFWTSNYILPVSVLKEMDGLCRSFLWGKSGQNLRIPLVAWERVCMGRKKGGLGIFSALSWNTASALKCIWDIHVKKESLWIKWIHGVYLKHEDIWQVKVRDKALVLYGGVDNLKCLISSCWKGDKIKLSALYYAIHPTANDVIWVLTQDRLHRRGVINANTCILCSSAASETRNHLLKGRGLKQQFKKMALTTSIYFIWRERNLRLFQQRSRSAGDLVRDIKFDVLTFILNTPSIAIEH